MNSKKNTSDKKWYFDLLYHEKNDKAKKNDGLATKVFEFGNKRVKEHFEDIKGFLAHKKMESMREIEK